VVEYASAARDRGVRVIVCAAALAAHLAGITASCTTLPVVGLPLSGGVADGLDALLATVQMPRGMPVATVGVDAAANAALLAVQVVAADDDELTAAVEGYRRQLVDDYRQADAAWQAAQSR
jgi:5-(carboxyamino)imidazole ribonucleotide mutase